MSQSSLFFRFSKKCVLFCVPLFLPLSVSSLLRGCVARNSTRPTADSTKFFSSSGVSDRAQIRIGDYSALRASWLEQGATDPVSDQVVMKLLALHKESQSKDSEKSTELLSDYNIIRSEILQNKALSAAQLQIFRLCFYDQDEWVMFLDDVAKRGFPSQGITNALPPLLIQMPKNLKDVLLAKVKTLYPKAYRAKYAFAAAGGGPFSAPMSPKRALDGLIRGLLDASSLFPASLSPEEALTKYDEFLRNHQSFLLAGTDFGQYDASDVLGVAQYLKEVMGKVQELAKKSADSNREKSLPWDVVLKGSFPSGKANLRKRAVWENPVEAVLHGANSSYSDIDMNVSPSDFIGEWKKYEKQAWQHLKSPIAKNLALGSNASADFQMHGWDPYGEVHGAALSPIAIRVTPDKIFLVVYKTFRLSDLPSKKSVALSG